MVKVSVSLIHLQTWLMAWTLYRHFSFCFFSFQLLRFSPESRPRAGSRDGWMQVRLRFYQLTPSSHSPVNHNRHSECLHSWPGPSRAGTCKPDYHLIITCTQTFHVLKGFPQLKPDSETCFPHVSCYCGKIYSAVWIKNLGVLHVCVVHFSPAALLCDYRAKPCDDVRFSNIEPTMN